MTLRRRELAHEAVVGHGRAAFVAAGDGLVTWRMHRLAGVRVERDGTAARMGVERDGTAAGVPAARDGLDLAVGIGPRRLGLGGTCVVERVVRDDHVVELTYRTAPGHAEDGTQTFRVTLGRDGEVRGRIISVSKPRHPVLRALPPLGRVGQRVVARRYLRALRRLAAS